MRRLRDRLFNAVDQDGIEFLLRTFGRINLVLVELRKRDNATPRLPLQYSLNSSGFRLVFLQVYFKALREENVGLVIQLPHSEARARG